MKSFIRYHDVKFYICIPLQDNLVHLLHILTCTPKIANKANKRIMAGDCTQAAALSRIIKLLGNCAVTVAIVLALCIYLFST